MKGARSRSWRMVIHTLRTCALVWAECLVFFTLLGQHRPVVVFLGSTGCCVLAFFYLVAEETFFACFAVQEPLGGGLLGVSFALVALLFWCWAFPQDYRLSAGLAWALSGAAVGVVRGSRIQRQERRRERRLFLMAQLESLRDRCDSDRQPLAPRWRLAESSSCEMLRNVTTYPTHPNLSTQMPSSLRRPSRLSPPRAATSHSGRSADHIRSEPGPLHIDVDSVITGDGMAGPRLAAAEDGLL